MVGASGLTIVGASGLSIVGAGCAMRVRGLERQMKRTPVACVLITLLAIVDPLHARQRASETEAEAFRQRLLDALVRGDRQAVSSMVEYRLLVDAGGMKIPVGDQASLIKLWNAVFPPVVRCVLEQSAVQKPGSPSPKYLTQTDAGGVSFGNGSIRADRRPGGLKVTNITLPAGYGSGLGGQPRRVAFRWGKGRVKYGGFLAADNVDVYLVQARQGDLLNAQLERVHVERASLRVVNSKDNRVLMPTAQGDPNRGWAGAVPESGEYRVEVVRRGAYCDPPVNYQVTISLD
jgi:hypothetical protein